MGYLQKARKILSLIVVVALMISLLPPTVSVNASEVIDSDTYNGVTWVLTDDGTITISGDGPMHYSGSSAENWTKYCDRITSVVICEGITDIFSTAFDDCPNLKSITIPDSVTEIKSYAFENCTSLTEVYIGSNVTMIGMKVFSGCSSLKKVTLTDNLKEIGSYAFAGCTSLTDISIPESVTSLDDGVFSGCSSLKSMTIPDNVTSMGNYFFHACTSLTDVTIGSGITYLDTETFLECSSLTNVILPDGLEEIGLCAFENCTGLKNIDIPNSVTSIHQEAFSGCTSLTEIVIPDGVSEIYRETFKGCASLKKVTIGSEVTSIDYRAFYGCSSLRNISIPDSVNSISEEAFAYCSSLDWVAMGNGIASLSSSIFRSCGNLMDIYYTGSEEAWNAIESNQFTWSSTPEDMEIHYNSTAPENETSENGQSEDLQSGTCGDNLTWTLDADGTLTISGSGDMTDWTETTAPTWYDWRESIVKVIIEDGVTSVGSFAFSNCPNLATVIVPSGVVRIGEGAFYNDIYQCNCATDLYYAGSEETWESDVSKGTNAFYRELSTYAVRFHYNSTGPEAGTEHIVSLTPKNTETDVDPGNYANGKLVLSVTFDEAIELGTGSVSLCDYKTDEIYRVISAEDETQQGNSVYISDDGMTLTVEFTNTLFSTYPYFSSVQSLIPHDTRLYVTVDEDTVIFSESGDPFVIGEKDTWSFTTKWGLDVDTDYLHFYNSDSSFGNPSGYPLSPILANMVKSYVMDDKLYFAKMEENLYDSVWTGSCYGMCAVTALAYAGLLDLEVWDVGADASCSCGDVTSPGDSTGEYGTLDLINYYHMLQYALDEHYESLAWNITIGEKTFEISEYDNVDNWEQIIETILSKAQNLQETKEPFLLKIHMEPSSNESVVHSVLVIGYHRDGDKNVLEVYDPSCINLYGEIVIEKDGLEYSHGPYSAFTSYTYAVSINSEEWGTDIPITSIGYTTIDQLNRYNIDDWVSSETSENATNLSVSGIDGQNLFAQSLSYTEIASDAEDCATICFYGNGDFVITNAEGQSISLEEDSLTSTMAIYDIHVLGDGSNFEYMILTDASSSFSASSDNDSICLSVLQDGIYMDAYADGNADMITITSDASVQIDGESVVSYRTHYIIEENELPMTGILGMSDGTVTFTCTENEQIKVSSDKLTDTLIRYYNTDTGSPKDVVVEDTDSGILVDTAGGGAVSAGSETIDASSLFTLLFGFSRMQLIMIAGLGIAAVGLIVFGVLFAVRFLGKKK